MNFGETLKAYVGKLTDSLRVGAVFGEPIEKYGKTIIPVVSYGFGFGLGGAFAGGDNETEEPPQSGGAGGGGGAEPLGVFEITETTTRFIPVIRLRQVLVAATIIFVHLNFYRIVKTLKKPRKKPRK
ncbi:MAG: hypothetical protein K8R90_01370 [Candidatus Cloacimonetes bacterium]|nr:hypothetical protein [Candidatus Cloacimonadota bacterium]